MGRAQLSADTSAEAVRARSQWTIDLPYMLKAEGALGTLVDGAKEHALMTMSGSPQPGVAATEPGHLPRGLRHFERLITAGITPRLEAKVENKLGKTPVQQWNTVGEIRGSELPGQIVILGAHLDSWDLGTGLTDNGAGSSVVLEAARAIAQSGVKPKRTIRFMLFSGEEQGLLGSRAYAGAHAAEADSVQAVLVLDNGTGMIVGQALQGRDDLGGHLARAARAGARPRRGQCAERDQEPAPTIWPLRPMGFPGSTSTSTRAATSTPTTRKATPSTRPSRAI